MATHLQSCVFSITIIQEVLGSSAEESFVTCSFAHLDLSQSIYNESLTFFDVYGIPCRARLSTCRVFQVGR